MNVDKIRFGMAVILAVGIATMAFCISYRALADLAVKMAISPAWMFPLIIDGLIVFGTYANYCARCDDKRRWPYMLLVLFCSSLSMILNASHALDVGTLTWQTLTCHGFAPFALFVSTEILMAMVNTQTDKAAKEARRMTAKSTPRKGDKRARIAQLANEGRTPSEIAKIVGRSERTVSRHLATLKTP